MKDLIERQTAIDAIKKWGLIDGLSEGEAIEILSDKKKVPSALKRKNANKNLIEREAALKLIDSLIIARNDWIDNKEGEIKGLNAARCVIEDLPSADPERNNGKWIIDGEFIDCSCCRKEKWSKNPYEDLVRRFKYCPNCGAKMEDQDE